MSTVPHTTTAKARRAFTLIELLTVIAIIGILAAILIPTVGAVRQTAQASVCASNLRQIAMGVILYAESNGGRLPGVAGSTMNRGVRNPQTNTANFSSASSVASSLQLSTHVNSFLSINKEGSLWRCPGNAAGADASLAYDSAAEITYLLNQNRSGGMNPVSPFGNASYSSARYPGGIKSAGASGNTSDGTPYSSITELSRIWMITDADSTNYGGYGGYPASSASDAVKLPHKGGRNYAFWDAHVEYRKADNLPANAGG